MALEFHESKLILNFTERLRWCIWLWKLWVLLGIIIHLSLYKQMARIPHFDSLDTAQEGLVWGLFVFCGCIKENDGMGWSFVSFGNLQKSSRCHWLTALTVNEAGSKALQRSPFLLCISTLLAGWVIQKLWWKKYARKTAEVNISSNFVPLL